MQLRLDDIFPHPCPRTGLSVRTDGCWRFFFGLPLTPTLWDVCRWPISGVSMYYACISRLLACCYCWQSLISKKQVKDSLFCQWTVFCLPLRPTLVCLSLPHALHHLFFGSSITKKTGQEKPTSGNLARSLTVPRGSSQTPRSRLRNLAHDLGL